MTRLLGRLALVPPTLVGVTLVTFALVHLAPGDPASLRAGTAAGVTPEVIAENRALAGLDKPLGQRYIGWLSRTARLDFGASLIDGRSVRARIGEALPRTAALGGIAAILAVMIAVPLGAWSAARRGRPSERLLEALLALGYALPPLVLALLLLRLGAGYGEGLLAPAACLALPSLVVLARHQRGALLAVLGADFVRTARAKGLAEAAVLRHALANALLPVVTLLGAQVPALLSGSVLVEQVFGVRGLGMFGYEALLARDYPMLMGLVTLSALLTLAGLVLSDIAYGLIDPRLRAPAEPRR